MNINCEKNKLKGILAEVVKAASQNAPMPILGHVLLVAQEGNLELTAMDTKFGVIGNLEVDMAEGGCLTCQAKLINDIVSNLPAGIVNLNSSNEGTLTITCGNSVFEIPTLPGDEYPGVPTLESGMNFKLKCAELNRLVNQVSIAAATNVESRPVMTGMLLDFKGDTLTGVATDGRRMARMCLHLEEAVPENLRVIVPAKNMQDISRILGKEDVEVIMSVTSSHLFFNCGNMNFFCRLLEGSYPDYRRVIPNDSKLTRRCRIGREQFQSSLNRAKIMAKDKVCPDVIRFNFEEEKMVMRAYTANFGSSQEELSIMMSGEPLEISFNGVFVSQVLSAMDCDDVEFNLQDERSGAVIRPVDDTDYDYVCMPLRS